MLKYTNDERVSFANVQLALLGVPLARLSHATDAELGGLSRAPAFSLAGMDQFPGRLVRAFEQELWNFVATQVQLSDRVRPTGSGNKRPVGIASCVLQQAGHLVVTLSPLRLQFPRKMRPIGATPIPNSDLT